MLTFYVLLTGFFDQWLYWSFVKVSAFILGFYTYIRGIMYSFKRLILLE